MREKIVEFHVCLMMFCARYLIIKALTMGTKKWKREQYSTTSSKEKISITTQFIIKFCRHDSFSLITKKPRYVWSYQQINIRQLWGQSRLPGFHFSLVRLKYILPFLHLTAIDTYNLSFCANISYTHQLLNW